MRLFIVCIQRGISVYCILKKSVETLVFLLVLNSLNHSDSYFFNITSVFNLSRASNCC